MAREAADVTAAAENLERAHQVHVNALSNNAEIQLGLLLAKRQVKPAVIVTHWSAPRGEHAGEMSKGSPIPALTHQRS